MASEKIGEIHYSGMFDFDGLQRLIFKWLKERGYVIDEKSLKVKPMGAGREVEWWIQGDRFQTEYVRFRVRVDIHSFDMETVDVMRHAKKVKMQKGRFTVIVIIDYATNYNKQFKGPYTKRLKAIMEKYIIGMEEEFFWWDPLYYEGQRLFTEIKKFLNMEAGYSAY